MPLLLNTVSSHYDAITRIGDDHTVIQVVDDGAFLKAHEYRMNTMDETRAWWRDRVASNLGSASPNDIGMILNAEYGNSGPLKSVTLPAEEAITLNTTSVARLRDMCATNGVTLNCAVNFAWHKLLSLYTGDDETIVGITLSGREMAVDNVESSVGMYINTLPLNVQWKTNTPSIQILQQLRDDISDMTVYGAMPLLEVIREWNISNGNSGSIEQPFQTVLVYENYPDAAGRAEEEHSKFQLSEVIEKLDMPLGLTALEEKGKLKLSLMYNGEWLVKERALELLNQVGRILDYIALHPDESHEAAGSAAISPGELAVVLGQRKRRNVPNLLPKDDRKIHDVFEAQVESNPNAICLSFNGSHITYQQMNRRANELASRILLHNQTDINSNNEDGHASKERHNKFVALYMDKGVDMIVAILAVLKAGMAYVPISKEWPQDRIDFVLKDCEARSVVTHQQYTKNFGGSCTSSITAIDVAATATDTDTTSPTENIDANEMYDDNTRHRCNAHNYGRSNDRDDDDNLAYVIYTSGTTGR